MRRHKSLGSLNLFLWYASYLSRASILLLSSLKSAQGAPLGAAAVVDGRQHSLLTEMTGNVFCPWFYELNSIIWKEAKLSLWTCSLSHSHRIIVNPGVFLSEPKFLTWRNLLLLESLHILQSLVLLWVRSWSWYLQEGLKVWLRVSKRQTRSHFYCQINTVQTLVWS